MDPTKDFTSERPRTFNGTNYNIGKHLWVLIFEHLMRTVEMLSWIESTAEGATEATQKDQLTWTVDETKATNYDSRAYNVIISFVDFEQYNLISICTIAYVAWRVLETRYEDTNKVKHSNYKFLQPSMKTFVCWNMKLLICSVLKEDMNSRRKRTSDTERREPMILKVILIRIGRRSNGIGILCLGH